MKPYAPGVGRCDHRRGQCGVRLLPCRAQPRSEFVSEPPFECPKQRRPNKSIMLRHDTISDVALGKIACDRNDRVEIAETVYYSPNRGHQLASLGVHVSAEQRSGFGRRLEKPAVEECPRSVGDPRKRSEACLDLVH